MDKDVTRLREIYRGWKTEDLKRAMAFEKKDYEAETLNIIKEELQSREVRMEELDAYRQTYAAEVEVLRDQMKIFCPKCHSLNVKKERPWWAYFIMGWSMFFLKKFQCYDCGYTFNYKVSMAKTGASRSPSKKELNEKWEGIPGMDHLKR